MRILLKIALCALLAIAIARFCHHQTHGFRLSKIQNNLHTDVPPLSSSIEMDQLDAILHQPFHYFNRGLQSFAFLSADGKYVLKIFNNRYQRQIALFGLLSQLPFCHLWAHEQLLYYQQKLQRTFESYQIAASELKTETALIYAHLAPSTNLPSSFTLIDPLEISHEIDLNRYGFVLQRKVDMAYPTLLKLIQAGNITEAKEKISALVQLLINRCERGIADNDPLIRTNFGFLDQRAIAVDIGPFSKDPAISNPAIYRPEIRRITTSLNHWLNEQAAPELTHFLEEQLERND
jgi:hypothetical protein